MPITQHRILKLLEEAEAFADAFDSLRKDIQALAYDALTSEERWKIAHGYASRNSLQRVRIEIERHKYQFTHKRNERMADRARNKREEYRVYRERPEDYVEPPLTEEWPESPSIAEQVARTPHATHANTPSEGTLAAQRANMPAQMTAGETAAVADDMERRKRESDALIAGEFPESERERLLRGDAPKY